MNYRTLQKMLATMTEKELDQEAIIFDGHNDTFHPIEYFGPFFTHEKNRIVVNDNHNAIAFKDVHISGFRKNNH